MISVETDLMINFFQLFEEHYSKYLTPQQFQTLKVLVWLIQANKQVKIERLAASFPLPILYASRRRQIQRFLIKPFLSITLLWFPVIEQIIYQQFSRSSRLIITIDRTQWSDKNILLVAVIWQKRALPIYWYLLSKKGASNLSEQQAVLKPVLKLLKKYELVIIGDREFHSVKLAYWLKSRNKTQKVFFAFRQKLLTKFRKGRSKYQSFNDLKLIPGVKSFLTGVSVTKFKGFGRFNVLAYQQRKYRTNHEQEPWFILTNLSDVEDVLKVYRARMGIEAMFSDCKTGGYNLEGSFANNQRLTSLILLISIAYTATAISGKIVKQTGLAKYIARLKEPKRKSRRHSSFWIGLYGDMWLSAWEFCQDFIQIIIDANPHKRGNYLRGFLAMSKIESSF